MKIKTLGFLTAAAVMSVSGVANANLLFDIYAGGTFGVGGSTYFADGNNESYSLQSYGAVLGIDVPMFRLEAEYDYSKTDDTTLNFGMLNAYFKLPTAVIKPYFGAGVGTTFSSKFEPSENISLDIDDTIAYQGMIGVTFDLPAIPFNVDVEGRVLYASELFEYANEKIDLLQYQGRIKLRYVF